MKQRDESVKGTNEDYQDNSTFYNLKLKGLGKNLVQTKLAKILKDKRAIQNKQLTPGGNDISRRVLRARRFSKVRHSESLTKQVNQVGQPYKNQIADMVAFTSTKGFR